MDRPYPSRSTNAGIDRRANMRFQDLTWAAIPVLLLIPNGAQAFDDLKYAVLKGQWVRGDGGMGRYDPTKLPGRRSSGPYRID
jgi:hypothetical protein